MIKEEMTPKERVVAFSKGEEIDRIICVPDMGVTMAPFIGVTARDYYHSAQLMADLEIALFKRLHHDGVSISTSLRGVAEAMGAKVGYPEYGISYLIEPAINSIDEIESLKVVDPLKDGNLPTLLEAIRLTRDALMDKVDVGAAMSGPFSVAASVVGTENLLKWMIKYPKKVHTLMDIVAESNNRYIEAVAKLGVSIGFADPVSSTSLISPKQFREFSLPALKKNINKIKEKTGGAPGIHICGKSKEIWEDVVNAGISNFSIDNAEDLEEAKNIMGDRVVITGNVPPVDIVYRGNKEAIFKSVKECIKKGHDSKKGYILSTGCQIPMHTPIENIEMFMEAGKTYGKYPIDL
ncbi:TPA: methylcobamide--CoM methyltransferase [Clostridium botulinum]|uniref:Putative methylcobalamin:Coenzyme M methyltransferase n=1 Tax=Clostridium botulinum (strain Langeland / NCTC 10281 / Type F) TaxID=441772 RepID=A7GDH6_CLOBL|nr:methylcobamide--CoM methyltransferase [Clostridium botulinum]ABS40035.1 putative methylcobalamin:Coenzyme M methyltransferase [Clostridium botulinum F str. Langeland]KKM43157.1 methylcobamide:CoM methyltransferase [Clostridium botulinum]MBY6791326.1 methylcobamide--CoM methyltransferase [Clostridium botulinum]MBY6936557.1 methylcobamide--CoM methyltransferase [Clostridium botulinum]MBY6943979.1 methylcobamide--CoM methyltransferase [Clostridium botulinum]